VTGASALRTLSGADCVTLLCYGRRFVERNGAAQEEGERWFTRHQSGALDAGSTALHVTLLVSENTDMDDGFTARRT
jgi:hypothetical protein